MKLTRVTFGKSKQMIGKVVTQIVTGLNIFLDKKYSGSTNTDYRAEIKNIQKPGNGVTSTPGIKVALINIEEDKIYKNHINPIPGRSVNSIDDINFLGGVPATRVNLYVLFAFNPQSDSSNAYLDSLSLLTYVLSYFAATPYQEIIIPATTITPIIPEKRFRVEINYHNISLEDSNNMWSNLGGEQKPYAMYQIKMLEIEADPQIELEQDKVLKVAPKISSPEYDANGNTIFVDANGDLHYSTNTTSAQEGIPKGDTNEIKHKKNNN